MCVFLGQLGVRWMRIRSYRLDHVRTLCERYHITDALSWLLERMGDIPGAMRLLLQALNEHVAKTFAGVRHRLRLRRIQSVTHYRPCPGVSFSLSLSLSPGPRQRPEPGEGTA